MAESVLALTTKISELYIETYIVKALVLNIYLERSFG